MTHMPPETLLTNRRFSASSLAIIWLFGGLGIWWLCLLHFPWVYNGGWGTDLPLNLLGCAVICCVIAGCWIFLPRERIQLSRTGWLLLIGAVLMSLPLLWSPSVLARQNALPRIVGLWGGVIFYLTLRQCRISSRHGLWLTLLLAGAGGIQAVNVLLQLTIPHSWLPKMAGMLLDKYGRSGVGIFGQVNVTSSFLAMSLGIMLLILGLRSAVLVSRGAERLRNGLLAAGIILISILLVLLKSRTGWLGGIIVIAGISVIFRHSRFRFSGHYQQALLVLPLAGVLIGILLLNVSPSQALQEHNQSNTQRKLTIYHTAMMMKEHPLAGFGAGTYQSAYQAHVAALPGGNPGKEMMNYPHNELLYQYAEGGIPALAGTILWGLAWLRLWRRARSALQMGLLLCSVPILLHSQLEYPFYYSVAHGLAVLQLVALAEGQDSAERRRNTNNTCVLGLTASLIITISSSYGCLTMLQSLLTARVLDQFEASTLPDPESITRLNVPWVLQPRFQHDLSLLRLIRFKTVPDTDSLHQFTIENARWLSVYADDAMYRNQVAVLNYLQDFQQAAIWKEKAERMFPWEASSFSQ